jgi:hypothetical protein
MRELVRHVAGAGAGTAPGANPRGLRRRRSHPGNLIEVMARRDGIVYAERVQNDLRIRELSDSYREMVALILSHVDANTRRRLDQLPLFIQLMSDEAATHLTRFERPRTPGEASSYDFSYDAITRHQSEGYDLVKRRWRMPARRRLPVPE